MIPINHEMDPIVGWRYPKGFTLMTRLSELHLSKPGILDVYLQATNYMARIIRKRRNQEQSFQDEFFKNGYDAIQTQVVAASYQGEWLDYQYAEQSAYPEQYFRQNLQEYDLQAGTNASQDPRFMTQQEKDRGLGSVFKCDDQRLQQLREKDVSEKDPNFISESYSECYPGYQEYNRKVVDSDDEADLSKMDMGGRAKGHLHRWDFETEEEWARYNDQKGAMLKAAFQFGVKMQDGRKTRKQNKDQKITNELHKINKILARKKMEKGEDYEDGGHYDDDLQPAKKLLI